MRRSGHLNGATVALELLPPEIDVDENGCLVAELCRHEQDVDMIGAKSEGQISGYGLKGENSTVSLECLAHAAKMPSGPSDLARSAEEELASGNLAAALGKMLLAVIEQGGADQRALYRISVVLAQLTRSREAFAVLSLIQGAAVEHPAVAALKGYLALQNGEVETGRRFLAKAALSSRGVASYRSVLHFTQHVLLVHQFNG